MPMCCTLLAVPQTIHPYITRKQPISIDSRSYCHVHFEVDVVVARCLLPLLLYISVFCLSISRVMVLFVSVVYVCVCVYESMPSSLSFVTQSHLIRFLSFFSHHKFPIILLHFISLEFLFFCSSSFSSSSCSL